MKNTLETRLGIFVALAVIAAVLIVEVVGGPDLFRPSYRLYALFNSAQDLKVGDRIKLAGVDVGRVEKIALDETNNKVRLTLKVRREVEVRTDSKATIKFTGLMGQSFVSLDFGSPGALLAKPGTVLESVEQPDLSAMVAKLDNVATGVENLTKSFSGEKIDNLLGPFINFMKDNQVPLTMTIADIQSISSQIRQGHGTVGRLIYDDSLYNSALASVTNLDNVAAQIQSTIADAHKVIDKVNAGEGTVGMLLHDDALYRETTDSMTNLKEILQKVNQGQGSVGKLVNDQEFYRNAKLSLQKLDKATEGLEDQGPLSVMGIIVNKLF
jgi:phospholipid/cholesterol/gamma-HCH transport system substrate-binding protein